MTSVSILSTIDLALEEINSSLEDNLTNVLPIVKQAIQYLNNHRGKQLRTKLVLLIAGALNNGKIIEKTKRGATLVTLLHQASLIHDDVVDGAAYRRHVETLNVVWGNKEAVLLGDYMVSCAWRMALLNQDYDFLTTLSEAVKVMSEGELMQLTHFQPAALPSEKIYFETIQKKTAFLMACCCAIGAMSVPSSPQQVVNMHEIGMLFGMAFQLQDDLLDYQQPYKTGKAIGMDLKSQTITLPLIYALQMAQPTVAQHILACILEVDKSNKVAEIIDFVVQSEGCSYTIQKINFFFQQVCEKIEKNIPASPWKDVLLELVYQTIKMNTW